MSLLPKDSLTSLSLAILAGLGLAAAHPAHAQVLYKQSFISRSVIVSQVFLDKPKYSSYCFDDFAVTGAGWDISKVTAFGSGGNSELNDAVSLAFTTTPDASAIATTYNGVEDAIGNLVFTQPIHLDPGNYFITAFVTRNYGDGSGQWFFKETTPVHGQSFYFSNPGGVFSGSSTPYHIHGAHDLAFEIDGTQSGDVPPAVPEPSSVLTFAFAALGIGGLMIAAKRKKAAPSLSSSLS